MVTTVARVEVRDDLDFSKETQNVTVKHALDVEVLRQPYSLRVSPRASNDGIRDGKQGRQQREVTQSLREAVAAQRANSLLSCQHAPLLSIC